MLVENLRNHYDITQGFEIGYEFEFCSNLKRKEVQLELNNHFLQSICWIPESSRCKSSVKYYPKHAYSLYCDKTIEPDNEKHFGHELVTPVWSLLSGVRKLHDILDWLKMINVSTNPSTGFHFSLSRPKFIIEKKKLLKFVDEKKWLKIFGRLDNIFTRPHNLKRKILESESARAVSFKRKNYIEFRMIGGKDYHLKANIIESVISHCVEAMLLSGTLY